MIKDTWEKNENASANKKEITVLKEHFPACFKEDGSFDIERFKEYLSEDINVVNEGYELKFLGKNYARLLVTLETETVIVPNEEHNQKEENKDSENIYITGDNLDGLKHLLKSYAGKVKCIYIDPPYNTGSDGFVYNDNFNFTVEELTEKLSIGEEQAQRILDLTKRGSASHSAWLMFMYSRLQLARDLLSDDGVIFISIDDNEQANLKLLCDDVFGEENFISTLTVENNPKGRKNSSYVSVSSEFCVCYCKDKDIGAFVENIPKNVNDMTLDEDGKYVHNSGKRVLVGENKYNNVVTNLNSDKHYTVYYHRDNKDMILKKEESINTKDSELVSNGYIRYISYNDDEFVENTYTENKFKELFKKKSLDFKDDKIYEKNFNSTIRIKSILNNRKYDAVINNEVVPFEIDLKSTSAKQDVEDLFGFTAFDYPKNTSFIKLLITLCTKENDIVLDFFSGSASTAHSVMLQNEEENLKRKFIMVQLPEVIDSKNIAYKHGYRSIDEIGRDRIIKAANRIKNEYPDTNIDLGFKHYTLLEPTNETINKLVEFTPNKDEMIINNTILDEFGVPTVITTWLNNDGYGLTSEAEKIMFAEYETYYKDKHLYLVHPELLNEAIEEIVVKYETDGDFNPENIVLFGYSFTWTELESLKTNLKRLQDTEKNLRINFDVRY
ncbi:DNA methyltransferase [Enterococcus faecalis]|uniref:site-specific DNA-methyltransferase n=1 Tax=Enterococcus TaxID=1350 RepID=UPI00192973E1|nr:MULTISPECIES: site-specific DNA-methyltransferase [Enterococcus]EIB6804464.1 site-specific DNA-methyltransferase [Enterococcus faecalis]EJR1589229.1 site-specific DNA-methyltransferase [Enterococcus faecalis]EKK5901930.1 site-specific DNA-methyltransferase [Enterococcus faecalis]EKZ0170645.1 site-specific DNA-methyltransferase [Enterococcus faecalis]EMD7416642.1 site-specific DNA-methyltransferase [Enterococcus faecalis]